MGAPFAVGDAQDGVDVIGPLFTGEGIPFPKGEPTPGQFCQVDTPFMAGPTARVAWFLIFREEARLRLTCKAIASRAIRRTGEPMIPTIRTLPPGRFVGVVTPVLLVVLGVVIAVGVWPILLFCVATGVVEPTVGVVFAVAVLVAVGDGLGVGVRVDPGLGVGEGLRARALKVNGADELSVGG